jgi:hypothetical protein
MAWGSSTGLRRNSASGLKKGRKGTVFHRVLSTFLPFVASVQSPVDNSNKSG